MIKYTALAFVCLTLAACNTFEGVGEDVEHAGDAIENSAEETHRELHKHY